MHLLSLHNVNPAVLCLGRLGEPYARDERKNYVRFS